MALFNRVRERDIGSTLGIIRMRKNDGWPAIVRWSPYPYFGYGAQLVNKECVWDNIPVGRYKPGKYKVTDVQLARITTQADAVSAEWGAYGSPAVRAEGTFVYPLVITPPSNYRTLVPSQKDIDNLGRLALSKANGPSVGVGETIAEAGSSLRMMLTPLSGLLGILRSCLYKGNGVSLRPMKDAASVWLELRYGWAPLYGTLCDIQKGLPVHKLNDLFDSHARSKPSVVSTQVGPFSRRVTGTDGYGFEVVGFQSTEVTKRFQAYYSVEHPALLHGVQHGMFLTNVPALLWELVPLSFALDWWWNFGDMIAAACPNPGIRELGYTFSVRETIHTVNVIRGLTANDLPTPGGASGMHKSTCDTYLRLVVPRPRLTPPPLDLNFNSLKHAFDAIGLIIQRIPRMH